MRETTELRETTWLPAFHLFGFVTEFALTFQPPLSAFQFAFTAQSRNVRNTILATVLGIIAGLYIIRGLTP